MLGVSKAIRNVNEVIGPALVAANLDIRAQEDVDAWLITLDGTENKCMLMRLPHDHIHGISKFGSQRDSRRVTSRCSGRCCSKGTLINFSEQL